MHVVQRLEHGQAPGDVRARGLIGAARQGHARGDLEQRAGERQVAAGRPAPVGEAVGRRGEIAARELELGPEEMQHSAGDAPRARKSAASSMRPPRSSAPSLIHAEATAPSSHD